MGRQPATQRRPGDKRRPEGDHRCTVDAVFRRRPRALARACACRRFRPLTLEPEVFAALGEMGWRRVVMPKGRYKGLDADYACIDYSAWPALCAHRPAGGRRLQDVDAIAAREKHIVWEEFNAWAPYPGIGALGEETEATPRDVPLAPGLRSVVPRARLQGVVGALVGFRFSGSGPGVQAPDGCSVDLYRKCLISANSKITGPVSRGREGPRAGLRSRPSDASAP